MTGPGVSSGASSPAPGFPGFGEGAPLDLSGLTPTAEAGIVDRFRDGTFDAWADTAAKVGYCTRPVRLVGGSSTVDARTGEVLDSFHSQDAPLGVVYRACGNRRAEACPSCSRTYARDTFAMIRSGLVGGKTVPDAVAENPLLFATFTAPSFGHVHGHRHRSGQPAGGRCRPRDTSQVCPHGRRTGCMAVHDADDPINGAPICRDCYDWESAVVWQWWAPELWRRTTIALRRHLATVLGVPERRLKSVASLQYAKVAEYQARGLIHFHAMIRLDGPGRPRLPRTPGRRRPRPGFESRWPGSHVHRAASRRATTSPGSSRGGGSSTSASSATDTAPTTPPGRSRRSRSPGTSRSTPPRTPAASAPPASTGPT